MISIHINTYFNGLSLADFKIRGPDYNGTVPAFSADCNGYNEGAPFRPCVLEEKQTPLDSDKNRGLAARLEYTPVSGTGAHIVITYQFSNLNQRLFNLFLFVETQFIINFSNFACVSSDKVLNYTGYKTTRYNQFWTPPLNFTIIPLETNSGMSGKKSTSC